MSDLEKATTDEIYDELAKRNHSLFLVTVKLLDDDRIETYRNFDGAFNLLFGELEELKLAITNLFIQRKQNNSSDDAQ